MALHRVVCDVRADFIQAGGWLTLSQVTGCDSTFYNEFGALADSVCERANAGAVQTGSQGARPSLCQDFVFVAARIGVPLQHLVPG